MINVKVSESKIISVPVRIDINEMIKYAIVKEIPNLKAITLQDFLDNYAEDGQIYSVGDEFLNKMIYSVRNGVKYFTDGYSYSRGKEEIRFYVKKIDERFPYIVTGDIYKDMSLKLCGSNTALLTLNMEGPVYTLI